MHGPFYSYHSRAVCVCVCLCFCLLQSSYSFLQLLEQCKTANDTATARLQKHYVRYLDCAKAIRATQAPLSAPVSARARDFRSANNSHIVDQLSALCRYEPQHTTRRHSSHHCHFFHSWFFIQQCAERKASLFCQFVLAAADLPFPFTQLSLSKSSFRQQNSFQVRRTAESSPRATNCWQYDLSMITSIAVADDTCRHIMAPSFLKDFRRKSKASFRTDHSTDSSGASNGTNGTTGFAPTTKSSTSTLNGATTPPALTNSTSNLHIFSSNGVPPIPERPTVLTSRSNRYSVSGMSGLGSPSQKSSLPTSPYAPRITSIAENTWVRGQS